MAQMTQAEVFIKYGVATDIHLGAHESQGLQSDRYQDAFNAFEEVLEKAEENMIDFLIIGGDLFHERSPSEITLLKCVTLLKKFVYGDTQNQIEIASSPVEINFLSPDHNIKLPIFTINGNHDNTYTDQDENVSILDILHQSKLVNYIGKIINQNLITVKPIIILKKGIKIALYGIGYLKDYQFNKLLKENKIILEDLSDKNFNILIIHQNRYKGSHYQSERDFLDPIQFRVFKISLLIWGHEHEPKQELEDLGGFQVFSPGSTVATSLIEAEGKIKQMGLFTVSKNNLTFSSIKLTNSHRPILLKNIDLKEIVRNKPDNIATQEYAERQLFDIVHDTLKQYFAQNQYRHKKPLLKVKVDSTGFDIMKMRFFETKFRDQVANPDKIFQFIKKHEAKDNNMKKQELQKIDEAFHQKFEDKIDSSNADCNYKIQQKLKSAKLTLIKPNEIQAIIEQNGTKKSDNAVDQIQDQMMVKYKKLFFQDQLGELNQFLNQQTEQEDQIVYTLKKYINEDFQNDLSSKHPEIHKNDNDINKICDKFVQFLDNNINFDQMQQFHIFPIQQQSYQPIMEGQDLIAQDRTGSGKTLAYAIPLLEKLRDEGVDPKIKDPQIVVLLPTRELAIQVNTEMNSILHQEGEFKIQALFGGTDIRQQIFDIKKGINIAVATPGRALDLLERGNLKLNSVRTLILDEADQMLNMGFQEDIEKFMKYLKDQNKEKVQILLFSATVPDWVRGISQKYMDPKRLFINLINRFETQTSITVKHYALPCAYDMMIGSLGDVVSVYGGRHSRTIIFCETKRDANEIVLKAKLPFEAQPLHGDIPQQQRTITFEGFKSGKFKCLIATNVASRGLDFPQVDLIVQCNPPKDIDTYIHRAGRTGRAGKEGVCITFYSKREATLIPRIERLARIKFIKISAPQHHEIIQASSRDLALSLKHVSQEIVALFEPVATQIMEEMGPTEALARALACVSGYKDKLKSRSLMGGFEGYVTYVLRCSTGFRAFGFVWNFLKDNFSQEVVSTVKGMKRLKEPNAVVFDIQEDAKEEFEATYQQLLESNKLRGFEIEQPQTLPEIIEDNYQVTQTTQVQQQVDPKIKRDQEVFIGGLDFQIEERDIQGFFRTQGVDFIQIRMLRDQDGAFKGIAFGICKSKDMVDKALNLNGHKMKGRPLRINMADQKPKK